MAAIAVAVSEAIETCDRCEAFFDECECMFELADLSEAAQERAHFDYTSDGHSCWDWDEMLASLKGFEKVFPVDVSDYSIGTYGHSYVTHDFTADDTIEELLGPRLANYLYQNYWNTLYEFSTYSKHSPLNVDGSPVWLTKLVNEGVNDPNATREVKRKSRILMQETCCPFTGVCFDETLLDPIRAFLKKPRFITFADLMTECLDAFVKDCVSDMEYQESFEAFKETSEANEWRYDREGGLK